MNKNMVDVTLHINEMVEYEKREAIQDELREINGVMVAVSHDEKPHMMFVGYDPLLTNSMDILDCIRNHGLKAQLVGL